MLISTFDIATHSGWAIYDIRKKPSAIECGDFKCEGKGAFEKAASMRGHMVRLLKGWRSLDRVPDLAVIEAPLTIIPQHVKRRADLAGESEETGTINPATVMQLNRLAGTAQTVLGGFGIRTIEVAPRTWQTIVPKQYRSYPPKKRAELTCDMLGIVATNEHKRDAALMAVWAAGHSQELKLMEMTRGAA